MARSVTYQPEDSVRVERMLRGAREVPEGTNMVLHFAEQLMGLPYVAHTLEVNAEEQLVVNLRQLDCTTFIECVMALTLATRHGQTSFHDFCGWLTTLRYREGRIQGYGSRNHYFSQWVQSNVALGLVEEITMEDFPYDGMQTLDLHYMSRHPESYVMLRDNPTRQHAIRQAEQEMDGVRVRYIPCDNLGLSAQRLSMVHDGDLLAIVTKKDGLDTTHLGLAKWGKDGRLHLLNASSIHKKVVLEPMTLQQYMRKHPSQLGIRVVRLL